MPRPRYQIRDDDVTTVHRWIRERFRTQSPRWPKEWGSLTAWDKFPLERPTAKKLQKWCDRWLDAEQWKQVQAIIRSARRDYSQYRNVRLSRKTHELLDSVAKRDNLTLLEVIERYLSEAVDRV